jgi:hypothetical protein
MRGDAHRTSPALSHVIPAPAGDSLKIPEPDRRMARGWPAGGADRRIQEQQLPASVQSQYVCAASPAAAAQMRTVDRVAGSRTVGMAPRAPGVPRTFVLHVFVQTRRTAARSPRVLRVSLRGIRTRTTMSRIGR